LVVLGVGEDLAITLVQAVTARDVEVGRVINTKMLYEVSEAERRAERETATYS
jgi:hypothetical protein